MWPRDNQADLIAFYGDPERDVAPQLVKVIPPFRMTYDGKALSHLMFHRLAAPALERALKRVWDYYGHDQAKIDALGISKTAGTYNKRKISGSDRWSNHAFGAAIDINAEENGFNMAGNIPAPMVAAFKAEGARWGGDYRGRTDPMHFEFCESGEPVRTFEQWLAFYGAPAGGEQQQPTGQDMRFTNITATVFGGPDDAMSGTQTAYGNLIAPGWWDRPGCALPTRMTERPLPIVRVRNRANGLTVDCPVIDVGPWNIKDPYWFAGTRPQAESGRDMSGRITNKAGIDLTPAAAKAIGLNGKGLVDWDFVDHLEATNGEVLDPPPKSTQPSDAGATLLPLLLLLLLTKERPMSDQPAMPQGQGDLMKVLLPLILQSAISGKPIDAKDLLPVLLQGLLGVQLALPRPTATPPAEPPVAPTAPQSANDALLQVLLQLLAGKSATPQGDVKPAPVEKPPVVPPADPTNSGADLWAKILGLLGVGGAAVAGTTGVAETSTALVTGIGSLIPLVGGIIGIWNPTVGRMIGGLGGLLHRVTAPSK